MARITDYSALARGGGPGRPPGEAHQRPLTARGEVAVAPAAQTDPMKVTILSVTRQYGVEVPAGNWAPRGTTLPVVGNHCLVKFDDLGDAWVGTDWNPY